MLIDWNHIAWGEAKPTNAQTRNGDGFWNDDEYAEEDDVW